jgi:hypothetical protein
MSIIICPGIHDAELTKSFIAECLDHRTVDILVFPGQGALTLSAIHILQFLNDRLGDRVKSPVIFISFSAGVVGAIIAARKWELLGGNIKAFIAIDGWGVPLWGNFPIHRLSHDYFTHWSSALISNGQDNFYAEPPVEHLSIWRSPQTTQGWWVDSTEASAPVRTPLSAAEFLHLLLKRCQQPSPERAEAL